MYVGICILFDNNNNNNETVYNYKLKVEWSSGVGWWPLVDKHSTLKWLQWYGSVLDMPLNCPRLVIFHHTLALMTFCLNRRKTTTQSLSSGFCWSSTAQSVLYDRLSFVWHFGVCVCSCSDCRSSSANRKGNSIWNQGWNDRRCQDWPPIQPHPVARETSVSDCFTLAVWPRLKGSCLVLPCASYNTTTLHVIPF